MPSSPSASVWCVPLETCLFGERQPTWLSPHDEAGSSIKISGPGKVNGRGKWPGNLGKYWIDEMDGGSPVRIWKPGREGWKFSVLPCINALKPKLSFNKTVIALLQERKSGYIHHLNCFVIFSLPESLANNQFLWKGPKSHSSYC